MVAAAGDSATVDGSALHGVHVALATPVDATGAPDRQALGRLVTRSLAGGVTALCITGSTGEGERLGRAGRRHVITAVRELAPPGTPVIPAPAGAVVEEVVSELHDLASLGADAALVPPPSYYPMDGAAVRAYYTAVADASPLPLLLYNIPMMTGVSLPPGVVAELAGHPRVVGFKDSSRDLEYFQDVVYATSAAAGFAVLTGTDTLLVASLVVGGHGAIAASANVVPELGRGVFAAVADGDWDTAHRLQARLVEVVRVCRTGAPPAGWKAALEHVRVGTRALVPPAYGLDHHEYAALSRCLDDLGVGP